MKEDDGGEEYRKVSFLMEPKKYKIIEAFARERGEKYPISHIINEACDQYIERRQNPGLIKDQIRQALREEPALVAEAVQIYAARQLQKK
jgi:hypothetical protein